MWIFRRNRKELVNCWFCGCDSNVDICNRSWWYCYQCEQYNGFDKSGDYRHSIPAMYTNTNNTRQQFCELNKEHSPPSTFSSTKSKNMLCSTCHANQNAKVYEMSLFVPTVEEFFDQECEEYEKYLEEKYKPCLSCRMVINYHLEEQDRQIHHTYASNKLSQNTLRRLDSKKQTCIDKTSSTVKYHLLHLLSLIGAYWLYHQQGGFKKNLLLPSFAFLIITLSVPLIVKKFNLPLFITSLLWLFSMFIGEDSTNTKSWVSRSTLVGVVCYFEVYCFVYALVQVFTNYRQKYLYSKQQQRRVKKLRSVPAKAKPAVVCQLTSVEQEDQISKADPVATKRELVIQEKVAVNPVTPDLLEGHLDAMFIEKRRCYEQRGVGNEKNHVIAALKYDTPHQFSSRGPLLKPATLMLVEESKNLTNEEGGLKIKEEDNIKGLDSVKKEVPLLNPYYVDSSSKTTTTPPPPAACMKAYKEEQYNIHHGIRLWSPLLLFVVLLVSVGCNIYFVSR